MIVGVGNDSLWVSFCRAVGRPDLDDPRFKTNALRVENYVELKKLLVPMFRSGSTQHWLDVLEPAAIPVGRVRSVPEALSNPQTADRQMLIEVEHPTVGRMRMTGNPIKMSGLSDAPALPPPLLGQHTEEVLAEKLNLSSEEIEALREEGALGP